MPADPATTVRPGIYGLPGTPDPSLSYRGVVRSIPGLIGYWRLQEMSGTAAADDLAAHAGTYANSPTLGEVGPFGGTHKSVYFGGANQHVAIASALANSSYRSVAAWVRSSTNQTSKMIFDEASGSGTAALTMRTGPNPVSGGTASNLSGGITGNNFSVLAGSAACPLNDGIWHHVAVVVQETTGTQWSATRTKLYYDGRLVIPAARSDENYVGTSRVAPTGAVAAKIASTAAGGSYWTGWISEVAVWANILTDAQVRALFNARR